MNSAIRESSSQAGVGELGQLVEGAPARGQRTKVRRTRKNEVSRDPSQHLRDAGLEGNLQRSEDVAVKFVVGLIKQLAGLDDRGNALAPLGGDGGLEEGLVASVGAE